MKTQANPPAQTLHALGLDAKTCPDPPVVGDDTGLVDRYEYQNPTLTCTIGPMSTVQEADVSSVGTRVATDIQRTKCVPPQPGSG